MCVRVCVCVCTKGKRERELERDRECLFFCSIIFVSDRVKQNSETRDSTDLCTVVLRMWSGDAFIRVFRIAILAQAILLLAILLFLSGELN